jgi:hypothetical protein
VRNPKEFSCGRPQHQSQNRPTRLLEDMFDDRSNPEPSETTPANAKVTARMLRIRELIELGEYPDRDELAERIVDSKTL